MSELEPWGWDEYFEAALGEVDLADDEIPARVISEHRGGVRLITEMGEAYGMTPGRMRHRAKGRRDLPAVGDWVIVRAEPTGPAAIRAILPRKTQFVRRLAGTEDREQVVAANIDLVFVMSSLNQELNPRRLERYLVAAWDSGAVPVVLLSKVDLVGDPTPAVAAVRELAAGAEVIAFSAVDGEGLDEIRGLLRPAETVALLGSSGVGKSTLVNRLAGEDLLATREIRGKDDRGRHTTTQRRIFRLPDGALLLDTPGMREVGLIDSEIGLDEAFDDVDELAVGCRFRDCMHETEPGCAVLAAVESGQLPEERLEAYRKLQRDGSYEQRRTDPAAARAEKARWKRIHKAMRKMPPKGD